MLTILHHLGLGDAIMLNGMVRHFAEKDDVCIFIQKQHEDSVRFMYRDLTNIKIKLLNSTDAQEMWSQVLGEILMDRKNRTHQCLIKKYQTKKIII